MIACHAPEPAACHAPEPAAVGCPLAGRAVPAGKERGPQPALKSRGEAACAAVTEARRVVDGHDARLVKGAKGRGGRPEVAAVSVLTTPYLCTLCFGSAIGPVRRPNDKDLEAHPWLPGDTEPSQQSKVAAMTARAPVDLKPRLLQVAGGVLGGKHVPRGPACYSWRAGGGG